MVELSEQQWSQVEEQLYAGRKLQAIKLVSETTGLRLVEARNLVESHEKELRTQFPDKFASQPGLSRRARWALALIGMLIGFLIFALVS